MLAYALALVDDPDDRALFCEIYECYEKSSTPWHCVCWAIPTTRRMPP